MKSKIILLLSLMQMLIFVGCSKTENPINEPGLQSKEKMTFTAGLSITKSYFGDSNGTLYWSDSDALGVYSTDADNSNTLVYSGKATLKSYVDADATFTSPDDRATWAGSASNLKFYAFYPNNIASAPTYTSASKSVTLDNVSSQQTGEFGLYHILYATPVSITSQSLIDGDEVAFNFNSATSLLRIRPYLDASTGLDEAKISKIVATIGEDKPLADQVTLNLENGTITPTGANPSSSITITFDMPITVTQNVSENEYINIVVLPIETNSATISFKAITENGAELSMQSKLAPAKFVAGKRYNSDVKISGSTDKLFYYGDANCLLLNRGVTSGTLSVAPYVTDHYFRQTGISASSDAPAATKAEIIWEEVVGMIANTTITGNTLTITRNNGTTYGNALVGIYDSSDKLLWSYHIWCPEDDPTATLSYTNTMSGETYNVMPMALGATKIISHYNASGDEAGTGLYYQWGRKDPLGRAASYTGNTIKTVYDKNGTAITLTNNNYRQDLGSYLSSNYVGDVADVTSPSHKTIARFMIDYSIANPTTFVYSTVDYYFNWLGQLNDFLWGNYRPNRTYPTVAQTYKSIFDPSPKGYRVALQDTWRNFTTNGYMQTVNSNFNVVSTDFAGNGGYEFYYQGIKTGATDFYPATGHRNGTTGLVSALRGYAYYWSSSTFGSGASHLHFYGTIVFQMKEENRAYGHMIRCIKE